MTEKTIKFNEGLQNLHHDKMAELKKLLPNLFDKDGNLIKAELENFATGYTAEKQEPFCFTWAGKQKAKGLAFKQSDVKLSLKPDDKRSKNTNTTQNLIIEGDNLQVLKLLVPSYKGKIKCIYIDPPYNTQHEFIYPDNYATSELDYLLESGQIEEGQDISGQSQKEKNTGRKHSNWLSFMYPRLVLARELLRADGVIFVSIDDNEVHHLRQIMNEIFGEEEFVAQIIWQRAYAPVNMNKYFSPNHDYILCYGKNISEIKNFGLERTDEANARYSNPDNDQRGEWKSGDFSVGPSVESKVYEITTPSGRKVLPPSGRCWRVSKEKFEELKNDNRVWFGDNGNNVPSLKRFLSEVQDKSIPLTVWTYDKVGHSQDAKKQLNDLFDGKAIFDYPKSTTLIKQILSLCTQPNDLILDFFAGSGTTGQAVMELNQEETDKQAKNGLFATPHPNPLPQGEREIVGGRKFILVQLPEKIDHKKEAFKFCQNNNLEPVISNITIERVRRAGEKYKSVDNGFRVFQLTESAINRKLMTKNIAKKEEIFAEIACSYGYGLNYQCCDLHNLGKGITRLEGNNRQALIILGEERIDNQTLAEIVLYSDYSKESQIFAQDACLDVEIIYNLYQHFEQKRVVVV